MRIFLLLVLAYTSLLWLRTASQASRLLNGDETFFGIFFTPEGKWVKVKVKAY